MNCRLILVAILFFGQLSLANAEPVPSPMDFLDKVFNAQDLIRNDASKYEEAKKACQEAQNYLAKLAKNDREPDYDLLILECFATVEASAKHIKEACGLYARASRGYEALSSTADKKSEKVKYIRSQTIKLGCTTSADGKPSFDKKALEANGFINPEFVVIKIPSNRAAKFSYELTLNVLMFRKSGWTPQLIDEEVKGAAKILAQCNIAMSPVKLALVDADSPIVNDYSIAISRPIAVFEKQRSDIFSRPQLAGTTDSKICEKIPTTCDMVWMTAASSEEPLSMKYRGIILAFILVRLMGNIEGFSGEPGNIFARNLDERGVSISPDQCNAMRQYSKLKALGK